MVIVCHLSLYCPSALPSPMVMVNGKTQAASGSSVPVGLRACAGLVGRVLRAWRLEMTYMDHQNRVYGFPDIKENGVQNFFGVTSYWILEEIVFYDTWIIHRTYLLDW